MTRLSSAFSTQDWVLPTMPSSIRDWNSLSMAGRVSGRCTSQQSCLWSLCTQVESLQRKFASIHLTLAQQQEQAAGAAPGTTQVRASINDSCSCHASNSTACLCGTPHEDRGKAIVCNAS